jgi:DNA mismatch repair protein MSH3
MVELTETCEILKASTSRSLIVLDELGRGTSTNDGLAIAHAVLQYIIKRVGAATIFITHFPQLAALASVSHITRFLRTALPCILKMVRHQKYPTQCKTFQMAYVEEVGIDRIPDITFLYKAV